jgi:hypothetical protein
MKQYLSPDQTSKLIELGFEKPSMAAPSLKWVDGEPNTTYELALEDALAYSLKNLV